MNIKNKCYLVYLSIIALIGLNLSLYSQEASLLEEQSIGMEEENNQLSTSLNLYKHNFNTEYDFTDIFSLQQLEEMHINYARWGSGDWNDINGFNNLNKFISEGDFQKLKILSLDYPNMLATSHGFHHRFLPTFDFSTFSPNLEVLSLKGFSFGNFSLHGTVIGKNNIEDLAKLSCLRELDLSHTHIYSLSVGSIFSLEKLNIDYVEPRESDIANVLDIALLAPNLKSLSVEYHTIRNNLVKNISTLSRLEYLNLSRGPISLCVDMRDFAKLTSLKELNLGSFYMITPEQIEQTNYATINSLEKLVLTGANVKKFNFATYVPNLKYLFLGNTNIGPQDVANIAKLLNLIYVDMGNTKISGSSIKKLVSLTSLQELNLASTDMRKADFSYLPGSLKELNLSSCELTIESFNTLFSLTQLEKLDIKGIKNSNITNDYFLSLREALPNCTIEF
jgi:hypothetical protein